MEDIIRKSLKKQVANRIDLAQDRNYSGVLVNAVLKFTSCVIGVADAVLLRVQYLQLLAGNYIVVSTP